MSEKPKKVDDLKIDSNWIDSLYKIDNITDKELSDWYSEIAYQGFDRNDVLKQLKSIGDTNLIIKVIILVAVRGPVKSLEIPLGNGKTMRNLGIISNGGKGNKKLSAGKILAATADLAAFYLKRINFPKRVNESLLPGWLQFPSAASIKLPEYYRNLHREFSREFSNRIGGIFNEQIYEAMVQNSYLNDNLKLF